MWLFGLRIAVPLLGLSEEWEVVRFFQVLEVAKQMLSNGLLPEIFFCVKQIFDCNPIFIFVINGIREIFDGKQINVLRRKADKEIHLVLSGVGTKYFYLFHKANSFLVWVLWVILFSDGDTGAMKRNSSFFKIFSWKKHLFEQERKDFFVKMA